MKVLAAPGLQCPKEGKPREYIPDSGEGVEVPDGSAYYQRLLADGSLILYSDAAKGAKKTKEANK